MSQLIDCGRLILRDYYGEKVFEIVPLENEVEVFDYVSASVRRIKTIDLTLWLRDNGLVIPQHTSAVDFD